MQWTLNNWQTVLTWTLRILSLLLIGGFGYLVLLGDNRWIPREQAKDIIAPVIKEVLKEELAPITDAISNQQESLKSHEHAANTHRELDGLFYTRREGNELSGKMQNHETAMLRELNRLNSGITELNRDVKEILKNMRVDSN